MEVERETRARRFGGRCRHRNRYRIGCGESAIGVDECNAGENMSQTARTLDVQQPQQLRPIMEVGKTFGLLESELISYGPYKAKITLDALKRPKKRPRCPLAGA